MHDERQALIVCNDLFFSSQLHGTAKKAGLAARTALSSAQAVPLLAGGAFTWVIVDLELPQLDLAGLCSAAKQSGARIVGFGPHVHEALLSQAKESGCDVVLSRGLAAARLDQVLAQPD